MTKIAYAVANQTADSFFDSCKDVQLPANNQRAIEVLCGSKDCTPQKLLSYMGSVTNGATPIDAQVTNLMQRCCSDVWGIDVM